MNWSSLALAGALSASSVGAVDTPVGSEGIPTDAKDVFSTQGWVPVTESNFISYANQEKQAVVGTINVENPPELTIKGNTWGVAPIGETAVTSDTYLRFDVSIPDSASSEFSGLQLLLSGSNLSVPVNSVPSRADSFIKVAGKHPYGPTGLSNLYDTAVGGWQTFDVKLPDSYVGLAVDHLVAVSDDDAKDLWGGGSNAEASYKNLILYEKNPSNPNMIPVNAKNLLSDAGDFMPYADQSDASDMVDISMSELPLTVTLSGNTWKAIGLNYTVTNDSIVDFEALIPQGVSSEFSGVSFLPSNVNPRDPNLWPAHDESTLIRLDGDHDYNGTAGLYDKTVGGWQRIRVNLSDYNNVGDDIRYALFISDDDARAKPYAAGSNAQVRFRNVAVYERNNAPVLSGEVDIEVMENSITFINLKPNSSDPDGDMTYGYGCEGFDNGVYSTRPGVLKYEPDKGYTGLDTGTCSIQDVRGAVSNAINVNINVNPIVETTPVIDPEPKDYVINIGETYPMFAQFSASDADGDNIEIHSCSNPSGNFTVSVASLSSHGGVNVCLISPNGVISSGDTIIYSVVDDDGNVSEPGMVNVSANLAGSTKLNYSLDSIPEGWCGIASYSGPELDDYMLNDTTLFQAVDNRINGNNDELPDGTKRAFVPRDNINFEDGKASIRVSPINGTAFEPIGIVTAAVMPDKVDGVCRGYQTTTNSPEDRALSEIPFKYLTIHDGVNDTEQVDLSTKVIPHILFNHAGYYYRILNDFSADPRVAACTATYPDPNTDDNGDGDPDQYQCINRDIEP